MNKDSINKRFIIATKELLKSGKAVRKGEIAEVLNISGSAFSEILSERLNVSTEHAAHLSYHYGISLDWLLLNIKPMFRPGHYDRRGAEYEMLPLGKRVAEPDGPYPSLLEFEEYYRERMVLLEGGMKRLMQDVAELRNLVVLPASDE